MKKLIVLIVIVTLLTGCKSMISKNGDNNNENAIAPIIEEMYNNQKDEETQKPSATLNNIHNEMEVNTGSDSYNEAFYLDGDLNYFLRKMKDDEFLGLKSTKDYSHIPNEMIIEVSKSVLENRSCKYVLENKLKSEYKTEYQSILKKVDLSKFSSFNDHLKEIDNYTDIYEVDLNNDNQEEYIFFTPMKTGGLDFLSALFIQECNGNFEVVDQLNFTIYEDIILFEFKNEIYLLQETDGYIYSTLGTVFLTKLSNTENILNSDYSNQKNIFDLDYLSINLNNVDVNFELVFGDDTNQSMVKLTDYMQAISYDLMNTQRFFYGDEIPFYDEYIESLEYFTSDENNYAKGVICKIDINNNGIDEYVKKDINNDKFSARYYTVNSSNQVEELEIDFKHPSSFILHQQWFKNIDGQIYTFNLYKKHNYYLLVCSILHGNEERFIASEVINYKRNIVVKSNDENITTINEMLPYASREYVIANSTYNINKPQPKEVALNYNIQYDQLLGEEVSQELQTAILTNEISEIYDKYNILDKQINEEKFLALYHQYELIDDEEDDASRNIIEQVVFELEEEVEYNELYIDNIYYFDINSDGKQEIVLNYTLPGTGHHRGAIILMLRENIWNYVTLDFPVSLVIESNGTTYGFRIEFNGNTRRVNGLRLYEFDKDLNTRELLITSKTSNFDMEELYFNPSYEKNKITNYVKSVALNVVEDTNNMFQDRDNVAYFDAFIDEGGAIARDELARLASSIYFFDYFDTRTKTSYFKIDFNNDGIDEFISSKIFSDYRWGSYIELYEYYLIDNNVHHGCLFETTYQQVWFKRIDDTIYAFALNIDDEFDNYKLMVFDIQGTVVNIVSEYILYPKVKEIKCKSEE